MRITVVNSQVEDKGKWKMLNVTYKNGAKTDRKGVVSFGKSKGAFTILAGASPGDEFEVKSEQDEKGFWIWVEASKVGHSDLGDPSASKPASRGGSWETPEERALRQAYIIRQSSLSTAVEYLNHNKKNYDVAEVFTLAKSFEEFVFGRKSNSQPNITEELSEIDEGI